jgi:hypothetical protein
MAEGAIWEFWADKRIGSGSDGSAKPVHFVPDCPCGSLPLRRLHRANHADSLGWFVAVQGWDLYSDETTKSLTAAQNTTVTAGNGVRACVCIPTIPGKGRPPSLGASAECKLVFNRYARARPLCMQACTPSVCGARCS